VIRSAIKLPYVVIVGVLLTAVLGTVAYRQLPAHLLPTFDTPAVQIVTFYPRHAAHGDGARHRQPARALDQGPSL